MTIYVKIDGINGQVSKKNYEKWFAVDDFSFGVSRSISAKPGNVADRESTKPTIRQLTVSKHLDAASPYLLMESLVGKSKDKVELHICHGDQDGAPYLQYTLNDVLISNYEVSGENTAGASLPRETITMSFSKIEMKYTPQDEKRKASSPIPVCYDLATASKA